MIAEYAPKMDQASLAALASTALLIANLNSTVAIATDVAAGIVYVLRTPVSDSYRKIRPENNPCDTPIS